MPSYITSIATAVPPYKFTQQEFMELARNLLHLPSFAAGTLEKILSSTRIKYRYGCMNIKTVSTEDIQSSLARRSELFQQIAANLVIQTAIECLKKASCSVDSISHLIIVSSTGAREPGIEKNIIETLKLSRHIRVYNLNFMGCSAAISAINLADEICMNNQDAKVLITNVELNTLHLSMRDYSLEKFISAAIFSDGAGACLVEGRHNKKMAWEIQKGFAQYYIEHYDAITLEIDEPAFRNSLSRKVPEIIKKHIKSYMVKVMSNSRLTIDDIGFFSIHPGGAKILDVIQEELKLSDVQMSFSEYILNNYGNMTSATQFFVLQQIKNSLQTEDANKHIMMFAPGPGLVMQSMILKIRFCRMC